MYPTNKYIDSAQVVSEPVNANDKARHENQKPLIRSVKVLEVFLQQASDAESMMVQH